MKIILRHKIFAAAVAAVLSVVFGISGATIIHEISEKEKTFSEEQKATDGKVLASVRVCDSEILSGKCETPEKYDENVRKVVKKYGGETLGAKITYKNEKETVYVILAKAGKYLNHGKTFFILDEKLPILLNKSSNLEPDGNVHRVYGEYSSDETPYYIMMDDTMAVMNYLFANGFQMQYYEPLTIFDDTNTAYNFYKNELGENFKINQIFNESLIAKSNYEKAIRSAIAIFLAIVAISILILGTFCFVVFKSEKKIVSTYRMFGATKKDVLKIYLLSGVELFIFSILVSPIIGAITLLIIG